MNILIVDDKEDNRYFLEALLKGKSHEVCFAANGAEALEILKYGGVDLIVSDILMPVMDGFELCRKVKTDEAMRFIPFIFYTATYTGPQDEEFAIKIGADRFLIKPCEPKVFMEAVGEVMAAVRRSHADFIPPPPKEEEVLKVYNERLVRKLEQKMLQLEKEVQARQDAEKILRESEEKYKSISDNIEDGYYEVDLAGNFTFFNRSMCRILGYSSSELMGMNNRKFMDPENAAKVFQTFNRVFTTGESARELDWALVKKDGSTCYIDTSVSLIKDGDGNVTGFRGIARDITERRSAEREKARLMEQLYQAQKMESVGRIAGGVAHDFNNFLSIILGYNEIVLSALDKNHPHHEPLYQIHQAGVRAKDLTRQLLAFSRKQVLEMHVVDANNVVTGFEKLLRRLIGEDIQLNLRLAPQPLMVNADTAQLEQVLMNLAVNARDAMPGGGILTISTEAVKLEPVYAQLKPEVPPGKYVMVEVSDTGCGMDKDILSRIFEPFFTTKGKDKGTGLGLATSYGIIKQHGGNIWVYSEIDHGTTFKIYLPSCEKIDVLQDTAIPLSDNFQGSETVLLVEDNEVVRNLSESILKSYGYTVLMFESGRAALAAIDTHAGPLHLILTDVIMPGMNGRDLVEKISKRFPNIKTLFMSGYTDDMMTHQGLLQHGVEFIQKPFSVKALAAKVREVLEKK